MTDTLFLQEGAKSVKLHPVVLFGVLDHYMRRTEGQKRVIGTLLGKVNAGVVEILNAFPVPHLEKAEEVAVGKDFNKQMFSLHQQVNSGEQIVGWYGTSVDGQSITEHSCLIHDFYGAECRQPVHLVVDTSLRSNTLGIKAYLSSPLTIGNRSLAAQFQQIRVDMVSTEGERIGLDAMLKANSKSKGGVDEVVSLSSDMDNLLTAMKKLQMMLQLVTDYVDDVVDGKVEKTNKMGRQIAQAVQAVPRIDPEKFEQMFNTGVQDLLMVSYLSQLTRAQLSVAERLNCSSATFGM